MAKASAIVKKSALKTGSPKKTNGGRDWAKMTIAQKRAMIRKADLDPVMAKKASLAFWKTVPATTTAVTGHTEQKTYSKDTKFSKAFIKQLLPKGKRFPRVMDAGAGVGRVTDDLLRHHSNQVDLLEPSKQLLVQAKERLEAKNKRSECRFTYLHQAMQDFKEAPGRYDLVWVQGVFLYMSDAEMIAFLEKVGRSLSPSGTLVVKEYVTDRSRRERSYLEDAEDNRLTPSNCPNVPISVVRSDPRHRAIFKKARMGIVEEMYQHGGKKAGDENDMMIYALRPPAWA